MRAQKPWIVEIHAPSAARASSRRPSSSKRARTRSFICAAAFSVKVIARIDSTATPSSITERTKRSTSTEVLPRARPRTDEDRAVAAIDRALLVTGELRHASTRQIVGYEQPPR